MVNIVIDSAQDSPKHFCLDAQGLNCPEPVMLLHKKIREMGTGDTLEVWTTDPSTQRDIPKFCSFLGHTLLEQTENSDRYFFLLRKGT